MAEMKTKATPVKVADFVAAVANPVRRADAEVLLPIMERISGAPATMWGPSIIGFGSYRYRYESGREGEICRIGFSPRSGHLVFYILNDFPGQDALLARLGKHKTSGDGAGCLYVNKLADIDMAVLEQMIAAAWANEKVDCC
ncbi:MAG: DUF1801 domain-containing protein [Sphingobium sp.]|nr:DUF1801 domain-containing protein [Sphingobium sp.]